VSQSGRADADLRTTNRPDARLPPDSNKKSQQKSEVVTVIPSTKRQSDYQGYRAGMPDRTVTISSMSILVGAGMIAAAILLSTLVTALGTRYLGFEGPSEESAWLIDRLTGSVYRCEAPARGKASCTAADIATGSIGGKSRPPQNPEP
jgi:hypothetical protein